MEAVLILIGLIVLSLAAWRWGVDTTEDVDSDEWRRRQDWSGSRSAR
jgi:hypothetical protein